jgi:hypothetical protein
VTRAVADHAAQDEVIWGNAAVIDDELRALGEPVPLGEWIELAFRGA